MKKKKKTLSEFKNQALIERIKNDLKDLKGKINNKFYMLQSDIQINFSLEIVK